MTYNVSSGTLNLIHSVTDDAVVVVASVAGGPAASVQQDAGVLPSSPGTAVSFEAEAVAASADRG